MHAAEKVIVVKPWGYEWVAFDNGAAAITILHIAHGRETSWHCHRRKDTRLVVLQGHVHTKWGTENGPPGGYASWKTLGPLQTLFIPRGIFHRTAAPNDLGCFPTAEDGAWLMEIEEPSDKEDLVRAEDAYGRGGKPYETEVVPYTGELLRLSREPQNFLGYTFQIGGKGELVADMAMPLGEDYLLGITKNRNTMRLADYVANFIANLGIRHVFSVSGGGSMVLVDAVGKHEGLKYVACHHEQAAAFAAESYARVNGIGCCLVTTGPGGTNTITGVASAWIDSIPVLFISGQVTLNTRKSGALRQFGIQESDIVSLVKPITKYAATLHDAKNIRSMLEYATHIARSGRPGPVWIDIPLDLQSTQINPEELLCAPNSDVVDVGAAGNALNAELVCDLLRHARRPVLIVGNGVRLAGAEARIRPLVDALGIPVVTSWTGSDLVGDHPLHIGHCGIFGDRASNFTVQNADLLLIIGSRMSIPQTGYNFAAFAREAKIIMVDVDVAEMNKASLRVTLPIVADAKAFVGALLKASPYGPTCHTAWTLHCCAWRARYPVVLPEYASTEEGINSFHFTDELCRRLPADVVVVTDMGTAFTGTFQSAKMKYGQRWITSSGHAPMGWGLPGAVGAAFASGRKVIAIVGDGGLMMNVQELATIAHHRLPIIIFVLNNKGYLAMKHTQANHFSRYVGAEGKDLFFPNLMALASAYDIAHHSIPNQVMLAQRLDEILAEEGPVLVEILMPEHQALYPRVSSKKRPDGTIVSAPLEDSFPFLPRDEFNAQMIVPTVEMLK